MDERAATLRIRDRAGLRSAGEARRALDATLGALRCALDDDDARAFSSALPSRLAKAITRQAPTSVRDLPALYAEVDRRERVGLGFAKEHAQVVLEVMGLEVDPEVVLRLRKHLPPSIAALLSPREPVPEPPLHVHAHPAVLPAQPQTLARARPGTAEPIADARHALAHTSSVARSAEPHAERMIETARSTRPGREDETLAQGRGGAGRK